MSTTRSAMTTSACSSVCWRTTIRICFNWLMNHGKPADALTLQRMVQLNSDTESGTWSCGNLIYVSPGARSGFSLLLHGVVAALVLLMPWPLSYTPIWLLLLSLVVFDCVRSQRRIHACQGEIKLLIDSRLRWQKTEWDIVGTPWVISSGDAAAPEACGNRP